MAFYAIILSILLAIEGVFNGVVGTFELEPVEQNEQVSITEKSEVIEEELVARVSNCDYDALEEQLIGILVANGWYEHDVPLVSTQQLVLEVYPESISFELPFGYSDVCAVQFTFSREYLDRENGPDFLRFIPDFNHREDRITVGVESFSNNPGDGPTASSDVQPIKTIDEGLQLITYQESREFVNIDFPRETACPCSHVYTVQLTDTMYPPEVH